MRRLLLILFIIGIVVLSGCANQTTTQEQITPPKQEIQETPKEPSVRINTLSDFENSEFCKTYNCAKDRSWDLRSGGTNNVYDNNINPTVSFEIVSDNGNVIDAGLMFYYRNELSDNDLQIVYNFLKSVDTEKDISAIKSYVSTNIEKSVSQIMQATPTTFSSFKVYAGKVGQEQIVHLEKIQEETAQTTATKQKIGDLVVSGEEAGTCYVSEINLWSEPKSAIDGAKVVGKISNACPQKTVSYYEEKDLRSSTGRIWYKVESDGATGWITDTYVLQKK